MSPRYTEKGVNSTVNKAEKMASTNAWSSVSPSLAAGRH